MNLNETSNTFAKWKKFLKKSQIIDDLQVDPTICAQLLTNQEEFEKETILDIAKKNFKKKRKKKS
jgi:hypothetical protein